MKSEFNDNTKEIISPSELSKGPKEIVNVLENIQNNAKEEVKVREIGDNEERSLKQKDSKDSKSDLDKLNQLQSSTANASSGGSGGASGAGGSAAGTAAAGAGAGIAACAVCAALAVGAVAVKTPTVVVNDIAIVENVTEADYVVDFINEDGEDIYIVLESGSKEIDVKVVNEKSGNYRVKVKNLSPSTSYVVIVKIKQEMGFYELARRSFKTGTRILTSAMKTMDVQPLVQLEGKFCFKFDYIDEKGIYDSFRVELVFSEEEVVKQEFTYKANDTVTIENLSEYLDRTATFSIYGIDAETKMEEQIFTYDFKMQ